MPNKTPLIDEKTFFHEATIKICGTLEIDKALDDFFHYAKEYLPVTSVNITRIYPLQRKIEIIARASEDGCKLIHKGIDIPESAWQIADENNLLMNDQKMGLIVNDNSQPIWEYLSKIPDYTNLHLPLLIIRFLQKEDRLFHVAFMGKPNSRYSQRHLDLALSLYPPLMVALNNYIQYDELRRLKEQVLADNRELRQQLSGIGRLNIIGENAGLKDTMDQVRQVAPTEAPVLILGETGTGKELLARAIHNLSSRRNGPFVPVNCGAIPSSLIDSELFGHMKGAFTGALTNHKGRFERANGGTIFLDEIGELPLSVQPRLLRVLQEQEIERVGGSEIIKVDNRIIAATHKDLFQLSETGSFRQDLFFRLKVFPIKIPPLRERIHDIPALVNHFMIKKASRLGRLAPMISHSEMEEIMSRQWKGNVRELEAAVEEALIRNPEGFLKFSRSDIQHKVSDRISAVDFCSFEEIVREYFTDLLKMTKGRIKGQGNAADISGLNPSTLRAKLRKYRISFGRKNIKE